MKTIEKINDLSCYVQDIENFHQIVEVNFSEQEKIRLEEVKKRKEYYSRLALNSYELSESVENEHLANVLRQRGEKYLNEVLSHDLNESTKKKLFLNIDSSQSLFYKSLQEYKEINSKTRKVIEHIANKFLSEFEMQFEFLKLASKKQFNETMKEILNLIMIALLLKCPTGNSFVTILPQNYFYRRTK